jgi:SsrA-binding protein
MTVPKTVEKDGTKHIADNRKARHDFFIEETYEAGIALTGTEVKSLRLGHVSLREAYAAVHDGEVFLHSMHISPYEQGNRFNHEPLRTRRLLMHRTEILKLHHSTRERGYTLVPLRLYFRHGRAKIEIGLAKGKHHYDKRDDLARRDAEREIEREARGRRDSF